MDAHGRPIESSVPRVLRIRGQEISPTEVEGHVAEIARGAFLQPRADVDADPTDEPDEDKEAGR